MKKISLAHRDIEELRDVNNAIQIAIQFAAEIFKEDFSIMSQLNRAGYKCQSLVSAIDKKIFSQTK